MSKPPAKSNRAVVPTTMEAVRRAQSAVAKKHNGQVPQGSYVGRLQRTVAKSTPQAATSNRTGPTNGASPSRPLQSPKALGNRSGVAHRVRP